MLTPIDIPVIAPALGTPSRVGLGRCLGVVLLAGVLSSGCRTQDPEEAFAGSVDVPRVTQLCREAFRVGREATFWARRDLEFGSYQPTWSDWEVVIYLDRLTWQIPWVRRTAGKNPATPRGASQPSYDAVAFDAMMIRARYRPASFQRSTNARIERLLGLIDEIASYYQLSKPETSSPPDGGSAQPREVLRN
jgi:hypothetical protein